MLLCPEPYQLAGLMLQPGLMIHVLLMLVLRMQFGHNS